MSTIASTILASRHAERLKMPAGSDSGISAAHLSTATVALLPTSIELERFFSATRLERRPGTALQQPAAGAHWNRQFLTTKGSSLTSGRCGGPHGNAAECPQRISVNHRQFVASVPVGSTDCNWRVISAAFPRKHLHDSPRSAGNSC